MDRAPHRSRHDLGRRVDLARRPKSSSKSPPSTTGNQSANRSISTTPKWTSRSRQPARPANTTATWRSMQWPAGSTTTPNSFGQRASPSWRTLQRQADQRRQAAETRANDAGVFGSLALSDPHSAAPTTPRVFDLQEKRARAPGARTTSLGSSGDLQPQKWAGKSDPDPGAHPQSHLLGRPVVDRRRDADRCRGHRQPTTSPLGPCVRGCLHRDRLDRRIGHEGSPLERRTGGRGRCRRRRPA